MTEPVLHLVTVLRDCADEAEAFWLRLAVQDCRNWRLVAVGAGTAGRALGRVGDRRVTVVGDMGIGDTGVGEAAGGGFGRAANAGLRHAVAAGAHRCLLIDPATLPPPGFVTEFGGFWMEEEWDAAAARLLRPHDPDRAWYAGGHIADGDVYGIPHERLGWRHDLPQRVDYAPLGCIGVSLAAMHRVGLLDESLSPRWAGAEYCLRLRDARIPIWYNPNALLPAPHTEDPADWDGYAALLRRRFENKVALRMAIDALRRTRERTGANAWPIARALWRGLRRTPPPPPRLPFNILYSGLYSGRYSGRSGRRQ